MEEEAVTTIVYRGYEVPVFMDEPGQQFWCVLDGEEVGFGSFNVDYEEDLKCLIDRKLDEIERFSSPWHGACLEWFDNEGYRDIRLKYRLREIKVYPVDGKADLEKIREDALNTLGAVCGTRN